MMSAQKLIVGGTSFILTGAVAFLVALKVAPEPRVAPPREPGGGGAEPASAAAPKGESPAEAYDRQIEEVASIRDAGPDRGFSAAVKLKNPAQRFLAMTMAMAAIAEKNPQQALGLLSEVEGLTADEFEELAVLALANLAETDPGAALDYLTANPRRFNRAPGPSGSRSNVNQQIWSGVFESLVGDGTGLTGEEPWIPQVLKSGNTLGAREMVRAMANSPRPEVAAATINRGLEDDRLYRPMLFGLFAGLTASPENLADGEDFATWRTWVEDSFEGGDRKLGLDFLFRAALRNGQFEQAEAMIAAAPAGSSRRGMQSQLDGMRERDVPGTGADR